MTSSKKTFLVTGVILLILAALLWTGGSPGAATTNPEPPERIIRVYGEAELSAPPDQVVIVLGVETKGKTAQAAVEENARLMEQVLQALLGTGLKKEQLKTGNYHLYSYREYWEPVRPLDPLQPQVEPEYRDLYRAYNELSVTLENLDATGATIDTAVKAGANQVQSVRFERKNAEGLKLQGLKAATAQAEAKGRAIADSAGIKIKGIKSLQEEFSSYTPFRTKLMQDAVIQEVHTPIIPGDINVQARVVVEYYF